MYTLTVHNFMGLQEAEIVLDGVTAVYGMNEAGKSALGKALYLITTGGLVTGTKLPNYIRHGTLGFEIHLERSGLLGLPGASFRVRRTQTSTTWWVDDVRVGQDELYQRRKDLFFPNIQTLSAGNVRTLLDADRFLALTDIDRTQMLLPEITGGNFETEIRSFLRQQNDTELIGALLRWMEENNLSLTDQDAIQQTVDEAIDTRRYAKRKIKEIETVHKALTAYLEEHHTPDNTGLNEELDRLNQERDNLLQARGAALENNALLMGLSASRELEFDPNRELTPVQQKIVLVRDYEKERLFFQNALNESMQWSGQEQLIREIQDQEDMIDVAHQRIQAKTAEIQEKNLQRDSVRTQLRSLQAQKRMTKAFLDSIQNNITTSTMEACWCCGVQETHYDIRQGMEESKTHWEGEYSRVEEDRVRKKAELDQVDAELNTLQQELTQIQNTLRQTQEYKQRLESVVLLDQEETEGRLRELNEEITRLSQEVRQEVSGSSVHYIDEQLAENRREQDSIRTLMAALDEHQRKVTELEVRTVELEALRQQIERMNQFVNLLGPQGILGMYMDDKSTTWYHHLERASHDLTRDARLVKPTFTGFDLGQIDHATGHYTPYALLSASAALRSRIALQYANACWSGYPFLMIDNAELHDQDHHNMLRTFLLRSIPPTMSVMIINSGMETVLGENELEGVALRSYLIENGTAREM